MTRTLVLVAAVWMAACRKSDVRPHRPLSADTLPTLVGAGDIADCTSDARELTARILDTIRGTVFAVVLCPIVILLRVLAVIAVLMEAGIRRLRGASAGTGT